MVVGVKVEFVEVENFFLCYSDFIEWGMIS